MIPSLSTGQSRYVSKEILELGDSLINTGIDTFIICSGYSVGGVTYKNSPNYDYCESTKNTYIFYMINGSTYIQKRNECKIFKTIKDDKSNVIQFLIDNYKTIHKEKILVSEYILPGTNKVNNVYVNHSSYVDFYINLHRKKKIIELDLFNFNESIGYKELLNLNYEHNNNSKIYKLKLQIDNYINNIKFTDM